MRSTCFTVFRKKSETGIQTPKRDIEIIHLRYEAVVAMRTGRENREER